MPARQLKEIEVPQKAYESTSIDGQPVIAANAPIPSAGWHVRVSAPFEVVQAPLISSTMVLTASALAAVVVTMLLGALFASMISRPLWVVARMAEALGRREILVAPRASYKEADAVAGAMQSAAIELEKLREHEHLVVSESSHRVKNILAVVQSLAQRTLSDKGPPSEVLPVFLKRLHALARAQDMLRSTNWQGAPLAEIVAGELTPREHGRAALDSKRKYDANILPALA
jgi:signal transduction histidine kinase